MFCGQSTDVSTYLQINIFLEFGRHVLDTLNHIQLTNMRIHKFTFLWIVEKMYIWKMISNSESKLHSTHKMIMIFPTPRSNWIFFSIQLHFYGVSTIQMIFGYEIDIGFLTLLNQNIDTTASTEKKPLLSIHVQLI